MEKLKNAEKSDQGKNREQLDQGGKPEQLNQRYARNLNTISRQEQDILGASRVTIIGLGGLGGGVCEMLARVGVGQLTLIDGDSFDAGNLNRQILSREDLIGVPKAVAAKQRVAAINSSVVVNARVEYLDPANMIQGIKGAGVVMDCLDSIEVRFNLQDAAQKAGIPIVSGAIAGVTGQVTSIFPGDAGYDLIYGQKSREQSKGVETFTGNIAYCALLTAAIQASECVKILLNRGEILRNKLLIAELWSNVFETVDLV